MEENTKGESNVNATLNIVAGIVKEIPVYQDTVQPAAKEVGKSLQTVAKTINIALAPIKALVWGYEKIEEYITKRVAEKLEKVPEENIVTPDPKIAVPAVEALRYTGHDSNLRELYANLIANSMDQSTIRESHPAFVEVLKNLSSDEGLLLKVFVNDDMFPIIDVKRTSEENGGYYLSLKNFGVFYQHTGIQNIDLVQSYINNLIRLGLLEIPSGISLSDTQEYIPLESHDSIIQIKRAVESNALYRVSFDRKLIQKTSFGKQFISCVVRDKEIS